MGFKLINQKIEVVCPKCSSPFLAIVRADNFFKKNSDEVIAGYAIYKCDDCSSVFAHIKFYFDKGSERIIEISFKGW